jgi:hypothetical protein
MEIIIVALLLLLLGTLFVFWHTTGNSRYVVLHLMTPGNHLSYKINVSCLGHCSIFTRELQLLEIQSFH